MIETTRFGQIEYTVDDVVHFTNGIPGFDEYTQFIILPVDHEQGSPFLFMQSVEDGDVCFLILDVIQFFPQYEIELDEQTVQKLNLKKPADASLFTIVTVPSELQTATTNLRAPLIINTQNRSGRQIILEKEDYPIKQPLFADQSERATVGQKG